VLVVIVIIEDTIDDIDDIAEDIMPLVVMDTPILSVLVIIDEVAAMLSVPVADGVIEAIPELDIEEVSPGDCICAAGEAAAPLLDGAAEYALQSMVAP
jgi:hypothetical protein